MKRWDEYEPRAVVPTEEMMKSKNVIAASPEVARSSPYVFGLGISTYQRTIGEDGKVSDESGHMPLPLYYVSPTNVKKRTGLACAVVKSGWYVAVEPGQPFELFVSNLRDTESVAWTPGAGFDVVLVRVKVDGNDADQANLMLLQNRTADLRVRGFTEYATQKDCPDIIRRFKFYRHDVTPGDEPEVLAPSPGQIRMCFQKGKRGSPLPRPRKLRREKAKPVKSMNEKTVFKKGLRISIPKDGAMEEETERWDFWEVRKKTLLPQTITIFIREKFWLECHGIIERPPAPKIPAAEVEEILSSATNGYTDNCQARS